MSDSRQSQESCPRCGVMPGELHHLGCDVEQCPECGAQLITSVRSLLDDEDRPANRDRIPWTGKWPGFLECEEFGWFAIGPPWVSCAPGTPGAIPDVNRLHGSGEAVWDPTLKRFVKVKQEPDASNLRSAGARRSWAPAPTSTKSC